MRFRGRFLALIGVVALTVTLLGWGERRLPTGPDGWRAAGTTAPVGHGERELRIATFNIHGCKGSDDRRDVKRVAKCLAGLDLVGLHEVRGWIWKDPPDQAAQLSQLLDFRDVDHVFAPAETQWFGTKRFGNGLLTSQTLISWQRIPLPRRYDRSCRNMLLAEIAWPPETLAVLVTHVTRSNDRERRIQLESVLDLFGRLEPPAILLADLNTPPGDPQMRKFLFRSDAVDALRQGGLEVAERVDWILIRGLECLESQRVATEASDHPLFTATLRRLAPAREFAEGGRAKSIEAR